MLNIYQSFNLLIIKGFGFVLILLYFCGIIYYL